MFDENGLRTVVLSLSDRGLKKYVRKSHFAYLPKVTKI